MNGIGYLDETGDFNGVWAIAHRLFHRADRTTRPKIENHPEVVCQNHDSTCV